MIRNKRSRLVFVLMIVAMLALAALPVDTGLRGDNHLGWKLEYRVDNGEQLEHEYCPRCR